MTQLDKKMTNCYNSDTVCEEIKSMTVIEMAVILQSFADSVKNVYAHAEYHPEGSDCKHPVLSVAAALADYRKLAYLHTTRLLLEKLTTSEYEPGGQVYVIEFADGNIKIGKSANAASRVKGISSGNQSVTLRKFFSERTESYSSIESAAHRKFSEFRKGGEFFTTSFEDAVNFIESLV